MRKYKEKQAICPNCLKINIYFRKAYKPVSPEIITYCKFCGHPIWK